MLVLSRKVNQVICIGPDIKIGVLEMLGDRVKLGIEAPTEVKILREELLERILRNGDYDYRKKDK